MPDHQFNKSEEFEEKLLGEVGLRRVQHYEIYDTFFALENEEVGHIHTIETGYENPETLVLIHGYGSGGVFYYKLIAELRHRFHIYAIDLYGMGSSARPGLKNFEFDHVINFFVNALEAWRVRLNLSNFVLMGHSMGGFISGHWVRLKNPPLKYLYLLSPAGFTNKDDETIKNESGFFKGLALGIYDWYLHDKKSNPFNLLVFKDFFLKRNFKSKRIGLPDKEAEYAAGYLSSTLDKDECGERAVGVLLRFARYSTYPISRVLKDIKDQQGFRYPIVVLYGQTDWMDVKHSREVNCDLDLKIEIDTIADCGHQILLQNAPGLAKRLIDDQNIGYDRLTQVNHLYLGILSQIQS